MGRRLTASKLQRRATLAKAREDYQAVPRPPRAYQQSGDTFVGNYASVAQEGVLWKVNVRVSSANMLLSGNPTDTDITDAGKTSLGLIAAPASGVVPVNIKGSGQKPARVAWYTATDTPTSNTTPWGTTSVSFSEKTGTGRNAQSHRTCAVGDPTGTPTYAGILAVVDALLTDDRKLELTGNSRGGITLLPEIAKLNLE